MKVILAAFLLVALCYQASAYSCPAVMQFYEEVIKCAEKIETASSVSALCREFRSGACSDLNQIYANNCGRNYGGDAIYSQLQGTMRDVKALCF